MLIYPPLIYPSFYFYLYFWHILGLFILFYTNMLMIKMVMTVMVMTMTLITIIIIRPRRMRCIRCRLLLQMQQHGQSSVCLSVGLLVTFLRTAKTTEPKLTWVNQRDHVLDGIQIPQGKEEILGVFQPIRKHWQSLLQCS